MKAFALSPLFIFAPLFSFAGAPSTPCIEKTDSIVIQTKAQDLSSQVRNERPQVKEVYVYCHNRNVLQSVTVFLPYGGGHPLNVAGATVTEDGMPFAEVHLPEKVQGGVLVRLSHEELESLSRGGQVSFHMRLDSDIMALPIGTYLLYR